MTLQRLHYINTFNYYGHLRTINLFVSNHENIWDHVLYCTIEYVKSVKCTVSVGCPWVFSIGLWTHLSPLQIRFSYICVFCFVV